MPFETLKVLYDNVSAELSKGRYANIRDVPISQCVLVGDSFTLPKSIRKMPIGRIVTKSFEEFNSICGMGEAGHYQVCVLLDRIITKDGNDYVTRIEEYHSNVVKPCLSGLGNQFLKESLRHYFRVSEVCMLLPYIQRSSIGALVRATREELISLWKLRDFGVYKVRSLLAILREREVWKGSRKIESDATQIARVKSPSSLGDACIRYEQLRHTLLEEDSREKLESTLRYWITLNDRWLPAKLLDMSLGDILAKSYTDLQAIPGIGKTKIAKLCVLLARIATMETAPRETMDNVSQTATNVMDDSLHSARGRLDEFLDYPSSPVWDHLRRLVCGSDFAEECVGRFVVSLKELPSTHWAKPLAEYGAMALDEFRSQRGWGKKVWRTVWGTFWQLGRIIENFPANSSHLSIFARPKFAQQAEQWVTRTLASDEIPSVEDIESLFLEPILEQVSCDIDDETGNMVRMTDRKFDSA